MCRAFEELAEKRADEKANERELETKKEIAKRLLARGNATIEEIAEDSSLPVSVVEELAGLQFA